MAPSKLKMLVLSILLITLNAEKCKCKEDPPEDEPPCHDEPDCEKWSDDYEIERSCKFRITDTRFQLENLILVEGDTHSRCPFEKYAEMNLAACDACAALHAPCSGTFVACPNCCYSSGPGPVKAIHCNMVPHHHECQDMIDWFMAKNSPTLNCTNVVGPIAANGTGILPTVNIDADVTYPEEVLQETIISTECQWSAHTKDCQHIPTKIRADCTDCYIQGVPHLLKQCCDQALDLAQDSKLFAKLIAKGIAPQLWIDGCHEPDVPLSRPPWNAKFPDHKKYANFTHDKAIEKMVQSIEQNYCSQGTKKVDGMCVDEDPWWETLAFLPQKDECLAPRRLQGAPRRLQETTEEETIVHQCAQVTDADAKDPAWPLPNTTWDTENETSSAISLYGTATVFPFSAALILLH